MRERERERVVQLLLVHVMTCKDKYQRREGVGGLVFISDIVFDSSPDQRVGCDHCAQLTSAYLGMERCSIDNFHRGVCLGTCVVDNFNVGIGRCRSLKKGYD